MILTELDILNAFYGYVDATNLKELITGRVYRTPRPINSQVEDVVISVLACGNGQIQSCFVNVNIYVPDIKRESEFILDEDRIAPLMRCGANIFAHGKFVYNVEGKDFDILFDMESQKIYEVNGANFHAVNHKIKARICTE